MPRILVTERDAAVREMLRSLLEEEGFGVEECDDGSSTLESVSREPPDLVFLDLGLSGLAGEHVAAAIKGDERTHLIPVVVLSDEPDDLARTQLLEMGVDEFLVKPLSRVQLKAKVRSLLRAKELHDRLLASFRGVELLEHMNMELIRDLRETRGGDEEFLVRALDRWNSWGGGLGAPSHLWIGTDRPGGIEATSLCHSDGAQAGRRTVRVERGRLLEILEPFRQMAFTYWSEGISSQALEVLWPDPPARPNLAGILEGGLWVLASGFPRSVSVYDSRWLASLARQYRVFCTFTSQLRATEEAFHYTLGALARAAEVHDDATGGHLQRVNAFSGFLAQALGCDRSFVRSVGNAAMMHDVGKIHIRAEILAKAGPLSDGEMEVIRSHPLFGARILGDSPRLADAREIALGHHERWDGTGYPRGLRGEEIPLMARIVALSDIYDALRSPRTYKEAFSHETAVRIVRQGDARTPAGAFDPRCLEAFLDVASQMDGLYQRYREDAPPKPQ